MVDFPDPSQVSIQYYNADTNQLLNPTNPSGREYNFATGVTNVRANAADNSNNIANCQNMVTFTPQGKSVVYSTRNLDLIRIIKPRKDNTWCPEKGWL